MPEPGRSFPDGQRAEKLIPVAESDLEKAVFGSGIMVLPVEFTKGLEFDAVLYPGSHQGRNILSDDGNAKLLYVAATRALHELCVLHEGDPHRVIVDSGPEKQENGAALNLCRIKSGPP